VDARWEKTSAQRDGVLEDGKTEGGFFSLLLVPCPSPALFVLATQARKKTGK